MQIAFWEGPRSSAPAKFVLKVIEPSNQTGKSHPASAWSELIDEGDEGCQVAHNCFCVVNVSKVTAAVVVRVPEDGMLGPVTLLGTVTLCQAREGSEK